MTDVIRYVLDRTFDAPRELVWEAWTNETYQARWYGPGVETVIHGNDPRAGGKWLVEMKGDGWSGYQRADYIEVERPSRLVFVQGMADENWNVVSNPKMPEWPKLMHTEVTFESTDDGRTEMRLIWTPHEASEAEIAFFASSLENMGRGWGMGMDILDDLLAELQT
ncbi:MAG: SRPBCC domain-containing protein [Boseongicola sp.]|nr:SRPBCC domain-containing protein [Boseongicola sp.]